MPSTKRALQPLSQPANKRIRLSDDELEELDKADLITKIRDLESELDELSQQSSTAATPKAEAASDNLLPEAQAKEKAHKARKLMVKGITKQMTWKPSCKTNSARFSFSSALHSKQVFDVLTNQPRDAKKMKKLLTFTPAEFRDNVARDGVQGSTRYASLNITGKGVTVRWNEDDGSFTVSGSYGLG